MHFEEYTMKTNLKIKQKLKTMFALFPESNFEKVTTKFPNFNFTEIKREFAPSYHLMSSEIEKKEDHYEVQFPLAGYKKEQLELEFEKAFLTVSAELKEDEETKFAKSFSETVYVSDDVDADEITADYNDGILTVKLPIQKNKKSKKIKF